MIDMIRYRDPELEALRGSISVLEGQVAELMKRKREMLELIESFCSRQMRELGDLTTKLLERELTRLQALLEQSPLDAQLQARVLQTASRLEQFRERRASSGVEIVPADLDAEEEERLRVAFREALRICHPDAVSPALKPRADQICRALVGAYRMKNLLAVEDILLQLRTEGVSGTQVLEEGARALLQARLETLSARRVLEEEFIGGLEQSQAYLRAAGIADWELYFAAARQALEAKLAAHDGSP